MYIGLYKTPNKALSCLVLSCLTVCAAVKGNGFQAVYSGIGYINQKIKARIGYHFPGN